MRSFASLLLKNPLYALLVVMAFAFLPEFMLASIADVQYAGGIAVVLMFLVPIFRVVAAAPIALATLRLGAKSGLLLLVICTAVTLLLAQFVEHNVTLGLVFVGIYFVPAFIFALILRHSVSLMLTIEIMVLIILGVILGAYVLNWIPDAKTVSEIVAMSFQKSDIGVDKQLSPQQLAMTVDLMTEFLAYMVPIAFLISQLMTLCLARWWQALLFNQGGFQTEFHHLRLPKLVAVIALGVVAFGMFPGLNNALPYGVFQGIVGLAMALLVIPSMGFIHWWLANKNKSMAWIVLVYIVLSLFGLWFIPLLAFLGAADAVFDLRARTKQPSTR